MNHSQASWTSQAGRKPPTRGTKSVISNRSFDSNVSDVSASEIEKLMQRTLANAQSAKNLIKELNQGLEATKGLKGSPAREGNTRPPSTRESFFGDSIADLEGSRTLRDSGSKGGLFGGVTSPKVMKGNREVPMRKKGGLGRLEGQGAAAKNFKLKGSVGGSRKSVKRRPSRKRVSKLPSINGKV